MTNDKLKFSWELFPIYFHWKLHKNANIAKFVYYEKTRMGEKILMSFSVYYDPLTKLRNRTKTRPKSAKLYNTRNIATLTSYQLNICFMVPGI